MKKTILRVLIVLVIVTAVFFSRAGANSLFRGSTVEAVGDLSVDFGVPAGQPIFNVTHMAPGDSETKSVLVHNDAATVRTVGVRGIKTNETGNLSQALTIVISQNGTDLYGGTTGTKTLGQFFTDSAGPNGIMLSPLAAGTSTVYSFTVEFVPSSGNEYQAKNVIFDIKIGISIDLPPACDALNLSGNPIFGTQNGDTLLGTQGNDLIIGFEGGDAIVGNGGDDCIIAGEGNDSLTGGNGHDALFGGPGADAIVSGNGNDYADGEAGRDTIVGGEGVDTLHGGEGNDLVTGDNGNDIMTGGPGNDTLQGSNGNDTMDGNDNNDTLVGANGNDILKGSAGTDMATGGNGVDTCEAETRFTCEL